jgi:hypothetical protein
LRQFKNRDLYLTLAKRNEKNTIYRMTDFEAHRSHYYQYLANEKGWSHVGVALLYSGLQAVLNGVILWDVTAGVVVYGVVVLVYARLRLPAVV